MTFQYGAKLDPYRKLRSEFGVKGVRQTVVVTNNPSTIDQNQILLVRFPNLGTNDVIVPGTARLAFKLSLTTGKDANRTIVNNIGRALVKKLSIKVEGNEIQSIDDADVWLCYSDLWKTKKEREDAVYQGIESANVAALRIGAGNKDATNAKDKAISDTFENRFCIPLDFELLESHMPFYQGALRDRLSYEITFNDYSRIIKTTDPLTTYSISGIALEFDMVTNADLARLIKAQYETKLSVLYDRVLRHRRITLDKSETVWNINLNTPALSMKGILLLFEDPKKAGKNWERDTEKFYNPKVTKVTVTIEGVPNQLYASGMLPYQHWDEICRHFADGQFRTAAGVSKELHMADVSVSEFLTEKYALWLDMRSTDDNSLHGTGRRIQNGSEGITLQLEKTAETAGVLNCYVYILMDATLQIQNGRFVNALY